MRTKFTLVAAVAMGLLSSTAGAVDWGGYVRVGPGQKQAGGDQARCFNGGGPNGGVASAAPGHGGIGRLGNECATYGEFALSQGMSAGGVNYKALLMTNFSKDGSEPGGATTGVQQIYVEGKGYDIAPNQTFWIGKRFYHRADVHFDDSFYVDMSGTGAGVEFGSVGGGNLGVAFFRKDDTTSTGNPGSRYNIDFEGLGLGAFGKLRLTGAYTDFSGAAGESGYGLSLQHNFAGVPGGAENTFWLQYASGSTGLDMGFLGDASAGQDTGGAALIGGTLGSDYTRWRIADSLAWLNGPFTAQTLIHYGEADNNGVKISTWSIGGRAAWAMSKNFKLQGELGYAETSPPVGDSRTIFKATFAPTLTVGSNYYDRPELRFYVSYFNMNDAYKLANAQRDNTTTSVGFQAEIWF